MVFDKRGYDIREVLRQEFLEKFSREPMEDPLKYISFLEARIMADPQEKKISAMARSFKDLEVQVENARQSVENLMK